MKIFKIIIVVFFLHFLTGCGEKKEYELELFLIALEAEINDEKLMDEIRFCPYDSLGYYLPIFDSFYSHLIKQKGWEIPVNLDSCDFDSSKINEFLLFAFQRHLKGDEINEEILLNEIVTLNKLSDTKKLQRIAEEKKILEDIISTNDANFAIGDTLNIILQVKSYNDDYHSIFYRGYPQSLDYSVADDTLKVKGILIEKHYHTDAPHIQKTPSLLDLVFTLKILALNRANVYYGDSFLAIGDEFSLYLEAYARLIDYP